MAPSPSPAREPLIGTLSEPLLAPKVSERRPRPFDPSSSPAGPRTRGRPAFAPLRRPGLHLCHRRPSRHPIRRLAPCFRRYGKLRRSASRRITRRDLATPTRPRFASGPPADASSRPLLTLGLASQQSSRPIAATQKKLTPPSSNLRHAARVHSAHHVRRPDERLSSRASAPPRPEPRPNKRRLDVISAQLQLSSSCLLLSFVLQLCWTVRAPTSGLSSELSSLPSSPRSRISTSSQFIVRLDAPLSATCVADLAFCRLLDHWRNNRCLRRHLRIRQRRLGLHRCPHVRQRRQHPGRPESR